MIFKLVLKDLRAYKNITSLVFLVQMLIAGLLIFRYSSWNLYMMYGYLIITYASVFYFFREKIQKTAILEASLPVKRKSIVTAKYLTSLILAVIGLSLWFVNAILAEKIFHQPETQLQHILYLKVLFMALFFIVIHKTIFTPAIFKCNMIGVIFFFLISWAVAILSIPLLFYPYKMSYNPYFVNEDLLLIIILSISMIVLFPLSFLISVIFYKNKDL